MHDAGKAIVGLLVFLAIAASPIWYQTLSGEVTGPPDLEIQSESPVCVAATGRMGGMAHPAA